LTGDLSAQATRKPVAIKRFSSPPQSCVGAIPTKKADSVDSEIVQERLGHSSVAFTLDVYSHVIGSLQREAAVKLDDVLGG
jgi:hypothetical protein